MNEHVAVHPALSILAGELSGKLSALFRQRAKVEFASAR